MASYFRNFRERLSFIYETGEAAAIAELVFEHFTGISRNQRIKEPDAAVPEKSVHAMEMAITELLLHRPVQYVLQEAWFCGHRFFVNESVLVPRPETELLVNEVTRVARLRTDAQEPLRILDIGTGSGCIAVSVKKNLTNAEVWAMDFSAAALETAKKNALTLETDIQFTEADITNPQTWNHFPSFNIVVSNPPYIPHHNLPEMSQNVTAFEPHEALFVPGNDALFFYRHIVAFCREKLLPGGYLVCEIHEDYGTEVADLYRQQGLINVQTLKDDFGKQRVVTGEKNNEETSR